MQKLRARGEKILIADTDEAVLNILRSHLDTAGYKVCEVATGQEVLSTSATERPDLIIMEPALPDMNGIDVCCQLQEGFSTRQIPVMFLASRHNGDDLLKAFSAGAYEYMTKPFTPAEVVSKVQAYFRRSRRDREANPLTGLPGGPQITAELNERIADQRLFAFLWADLGNFKAFNDYYGFLRGDQAIQLLAKTVEEAIQFLGNQDDFLGHIGGDDFIVITTPDRARALCTRILATFDDRITTLYDEVDARRGYIEAESRQGTLVRYPLMTVSIGAITNERRRIDSYLRASSVAAEVLRHAKSLPGSSYYFDQRENGVSLKAPPAPPGHKIPADREQVQTGRQGEFVSLIAHELRTPVTAIQTSLEDLMQSIPEELTPHHRELIEAACRRARRLAATVSDLATYDRLERGKIELALHSADLSSLVAGVIEYFSWLAEEKGISLKATIADDITPITVDQDKLVLVLRYLVENALKFTPPGGAVTLAACSGESDFKLEVTDTGIGIPQRELATIFRSFCQVEKSITRREPGMGLGLYLAKKLVRAMGGHMEVQSQDGSGSTFTAILPKKWSASTATLKSLQDTASTTLNGIQSQLQGLTYDLRGRPGFLPGLDQTIGAIKSGVCELDVVASQAVFLAEEAGKQLQREQESVLSLRTEILVVLESILALIERHQPYSLGLSKRIARHALAIAKEMSLTKIEQEALYIAALLHDLGMMSVPWHVLMKEGPLTEDEWKLVREHPQTAADVLSHVRLLAPVLPIILSHHERYDGNGYPGRIKGWDIPTGARVLTVASAYDAMISPRPYRQAMTAQTAKNAITSESGKSFDPRVTKAFLEAWESGEMDCS